MAKVRVSLCPNSGRNRSQIQATFVLTHNHNNTSSEQVLAQLESTARNKLRISAKKSPLRFFLRHKQGLELTASNIVQELFHTQSDKDIVLHVSTGESYVSPQGRVVTSKSGEIIKTLEKPPRWPFPFGQHSNAVADNHPPRSSSPPQHVEEYQMQRESSPPIETTNSKSPFANLDGNVLKAVKELARSNPYISVKDQGEGIVSVDYSDIAAFEHQQQGASNTTKEDAKLLSECRGLLLASEDGRVLARRFHKFYNIHEAHNHQHRVIRDMDLQGAWMMEKLDGFLASPYLSPNPSTSGKNTNNSVCWATRQEKSIHVESLVARLGSEIYLPFVQRWLHNGYTPIFECICSNADPKRPHKGIVSYDEDNLVLIAIRHNVSGLYLAWDQVVGSVKSLSPSLPVARLIRRVESNETLDQIVDQVRTQTTAVGQAEGVVLVLADGQQRFKIKTQWYVNTQSASTVKSKHHQHNSDPALLLCLKESKEQLQLSDIPNHFLWELALFDWLVEGPCAWDDLRSNMMQQMGASSSCPANVLLYFVNTIRSKVILLNQSLDDWSKKDHVRTHRDEALQVAEAAGWPSSLLQTYFQEHEGQHSLRVLSQWLWKKLITKSEWKALQGLLGLEFTALTDIYTDPRALLEHMFGNRRGSHEESTTIILRAIPGSGKSFFTEQVLLPYLRESLGVHDISVSSADHFFIVGKQYRFDRSRLSEAHEACRQSFLRPAQVKIVDNTNTTCWEYSFYKRHSSNYWVVEIDATGPGKIENVHGVPREVVSGMRSRWEQDPDHTRVLRFHNFVDL